MQGSTALPWCRKHVGKILRLYGENEQIKQRQRVIRFEHLESSQGRRPHPAQGHSHRAAVGVLFGIRPHWQRHWCRSLCRRLLENPSIQAQIGKLQEQAEKCEERRVERAFSINREFLDSNLAHLIVNGETHAVRGDADKVKAIEVGYRTLGMIQPSQVVNQAVASTAGTIPVQERTMRQVYKSKWLVDREAAMSTQLEQEYGPIPHKEMGAK